MHVLTDDDTVDVVGKRKDGGIDMVISVSGPLDDSDETLSLLERKIRNYLHGAKSKRFAEHFGAKVGCSVSIYISCAYPIASAAMSVIDSMKILAAKEGVNLELRERVGEDA